MSLRMISTRKTGTAGRILAAVAVAALAFAPAIAEARPGGSKSSGSRGANTNAAPPSTSTAPNAAQPMQRSATPNTGAQPGAAAARPAVPAAGAAAAAAQAAKPSFARTMMMGLGAGLLGAGLFGLLSGSGLFGGLGGIASFLGLILQAALIAGAIYLVVRFFRNRREQAGQPAMASANGMNAAGMNSPDLNMSREAYQPGNQNNMPYGAMAGAAATAAPLLQPLELNGGDFEQFEQRLQDVMAAYSKQDLVALGKVATPEMVGYFAEDLAENAQKGLIDVTRDVKLVKGDLSEAWSEGAGEYATVAMRFSMINTLSDRTTGKIIEGHATIAHEATEIWTFLRQRGGEWQLSAIQQTA